LAVKILKGFFLGIIANLIGMYLYIFFVIREEAFYILEQAYKEGFLGGIIGLGAILNLLLFFFLLTSKIGKFKKQTQFYEARGVLLATVVAALAVLYFEF
jgi:hypothetical protein